MIGLSKRAKNCHDSATLSLNARAQELKAQGKNVISFAAGQPDFEPPELLKSATISAIKKTGTAKYTAVSGIPELKKLIVEKLWKNNQINYTTKNISINVGAKHSIYNIVQAVINPGDEVIIPKPYWLSYPEIVTLADGKNVFINTDKNFKLTADSVRKAITKKTKLLIVNSPSNPTGAVIEERELQRIAELAVKHQFYVISDEIYEKMVYEGRHVSIASCNESIKKLTFTVNSMSKSFAIPGWRFGYVAGPEEEIAAINRIQSQSTSNVSSIVQYAAIEALLKCNTFFESVRKEYRKRRDLMVHELNNIKGVYCFLPGGAFYVFAKVPVKDDWKLTEKLLEEKHLAVVPGSEFGMKGHIRLSYAIDQTSIKKGVQRLKEYLEESKTTL